MSKLNFTTLNKTLHKLVNTSLQTFKGLTPSVILWHLEWKEWKKFFEEFHAWPPFLVADKSFGEARFHPGLRTIELLQVSSTFQRARSLPYNALQGIKTLHVGSFGWFDLRVLLSLVTRVLKIRCGPRVVVVALNPCSRSPDHIYL